MPKATLRSTVRNVLERPISISTVNSSTGLLSVTAPTGFVGTLQVRAMVAQAAAIDGLSNDTQVININVGPAAVSHGGFGVVLASSPNQVNAGQQVTYQLTVANNGPAASQNVNVAVALPSGFTFVSGVSSLGTFNFVNGVLTLNIPTLSSGGFVNGTIVAAVPQTAAGTNIATASIVSSSTTDPSVVNNLATALTSVNPTPTNNSVSGYVYVDTNNDGDRFVDVNGQRLAHLGIPNVLVELRNVNNVTVATTRTDAAGFYRFSNFQPACIRW